MRNELAEYLVEHARREGYSLPARPLVLIETEAELEVGTFGIAVATQEAAGEGRRPHIDAAARAVPPVAPTLARRNRPRRRPPRRAVEEPPARRRNDGLHAVP